jgi:hypothetical protein
MHQLSLGLIALAVAALRCGGSATQPPPADSMILVSPTSVVQVTFDGPTSRILGPQVDLIHDKDSLRGRGPSGLVDLRKDEDTLRGIVGGGPTELHLEPLGDGEGFALRGLFAGVLGRLDVRPDRIEGQLGRCQYNLRGYAVEQGTAYNGRRICSRRSMEPASFTLSAGAAALEPIDRAALVAVLLGR